jgi:UDP-N-acetylmuramoyl-L-alanyl-D-glutamate--2,6-diaminopimelate ligase
MTSTEQIDRISVTEPALPPTARPAPVALSLAELIRAIPEAILTDEASCTVRITGAHHDSRRVGPGDLFVARRGEHADGAMYIEDALARGAAAILVERGSKVATRGAPRVEAVDARRALAYASAAIYGHPTVDLKVVGITGTNGKTTTASLVQAAIDGTGGSAGVIGTLGHKFKDFELPAQHTTPEADEIARISSEMRARGASHLVMEVSSVALAQKRVEAVRFRVAAFTNLTQDHLDFHRSMAAYAAAKARLFLDLAPDAAAINVDDPIGRDLVQRIGRVCPHPPSKLPLVRVSSEVGASAEIADIAPTAVALGPWGIRAAVRTPTGPIRLVSPLLGSHNVANLLLALGITYLLDISLEAAAAALDNCVGVPGRLERCDDPTRDDVIVLVDYAHTPDALERALASVRALFPSTPGNPPRSFRCVIGCGGDRDATKRPVMGEVVGRLADVAFITNDNPRTENPQHIADALLAGLAGRPARVVVELDRRRAIERAVLEAQDSDVILVAGKGHETYQILGATTSPFDDRNEARRSLAERRRLHTLANAACARPAREEKA